MSDDAPLTEDEQMLVDSYATLMIDEDGNIDNKLLETIPARLRGDVIKASALVKSSQGGMETPDFEIKDFQWKE